MKIKNTLKKLNQRGFSHHLIMPAVVLVAVTAIGVKVLTQSHAATNYRFVHYANQMSGGTLVTKSGGTSYRAIDCSNSGRSCTPSTSNYLYTFVSKAEMTNTKQVCTHYLGGAGFLNIRHSSGKQVTGAIGGSSGNLCVTVDASTWADGAIYVSVLSDGNPSNPISKAQIDTIYGKP